MAQITTEKRTTATPAMRSHTTKTSASSAATKENAKHHHNRVLTPPRSKGIEILDFHESWLEEVELYKDKMVMCKELSHHNNKHASESQSAHQSHTFNSSNHRNPRRLHNEKQRSSAGGNSAVIKTTTKLQHQHHNQHQKSSASQSLKKTTDASAAAVVTAAPAKTPPPRITPKLNSVPAPVVGVLQSEPYKKVQVRIDSRQRIILNHCATLYTLYSVCPLVAKFGEAALS